MNEAGVSAGNPIRGRGSLVQVQPFPPPILIVGDLDGIKKLMQPNDFYLFQ